MKPSKGINLSGGKPRKPFGPLFSVPLVLLLGAAALVSATFFYFSKDLPDLRDLTGYQPVLVNEFYSSDGELLAQQGLEKRVIVDLEKIPPHVVDAFIAVEDRRFYQHGGVDAKSVIRAIVQNLVRGRIVSGGSTITQQITKNLILGPQRAYSRKVKEAILSYRIEKNLSKKEILYLYLNQIYLADGVYGVEMASRNYFGKSVSEINIAEACLLAGIPRRPELYSPRANPETARKRQKTVIKIVREQGFITDEQRDEALEYGMRVIPKRRPRGEYVAPYFIEYARDYLEKKVSRKAYEKGGYKIYTTLDADLSVAAYRALRRGVRNLEKRQGRARFTLARLKTAEKVEEFRKQQRNLVLENGKTYRGVVTVVGESDAETSFATVEVGSEKRTIRYIVDPDRYYPPPPDRYLLAENLMVGDVLRVRVSTDPQGVKDIVPLLNPRVQGALLSMDVNGNVLSMVGGYDFWQSKFNRSVQARRQPGSAFKPFVYSAAIDKGYTQTSKLHDVPIIIDDWVPENYDEEYMGSVFLRESLINSRNLSSIRLIMDINPQYVADYSGYFGFESSIRPYPSLALGSSEVSLLELTSAYSVFANAGVYRKPKFILRIYDRNGTLIEDNTGEMYLQYERKLKQRKEEEKLRVVNEIARSKGYEDYGQAVAPPPVQEEEPRPSGFFGLQEREFLTAEEFLLLIRKVPVSYFVSEDDFKRVISPETAYVMTDMMEGVISQGTGISANWLNAKAKIAGKTGTTNNYTDAWFLGYSPMIVTGVWIGKDDNTPLGNKEAGSRAAVPVWAEFMNKALGKYRERTEFEVPPGIKIVNTPIGEISYKMRPRREEVIKGLNIRMRSDRNRAREFRDYDLRIDSLFREGEGAEDGG